MKLILASASPYRRVLLDRLGVAYQAEEHQCDERAVPPASSLQAHAVAIAVAKAASLAPLWPDAHILGSDQIAVLEGEILHKPGRPERAQEQLSRLAGKEHQLLTAVALRLPSGAVHHKLDVHHMKMRPLSSLEIQRYVALDSPLDCCGSYKIEGAGISLFEEVRGEDFTAIMGLPLMQVAHLLRMCGLDLP